MNEVEITTLCENTANSRGLLGEHGLSFFLRVNGRRVLFDTGAGRTLIHNARALGIDLEEVELVVLSHGHYDHTGGLEELLAVTGPVDVYGHRDLFGAKYKVKEGKARYNGIPATREELEAKGARLHLGTGPQEILPGLWMTGEVPRVTNFEKPEEDFYVQAGEEMIPDRLADDQALVLMTGRGPVVLLGCAHSGVVNTLRHISSFLGVERIYALMGGTHLRSSTRERIDLTIEAFREFNVQRLSVSHCTGFRASAAFARAFGSGFAPGNVGHVFRLE